MKTASNSTSVSYVPVSEVHLQPQECIHLMLQTLRADPSVCTLQTVIQLPGNFQVKSQFWDFLWHSLIQIVPFLRPGKDYTLEQLLGTDHWNAMNHAEARMADRCVSLMLQKKAVRLTERRNMTSTRAMYRLA